MYLQQLNTRNPKIPDSSRPHFGQISAFINNIESGVGTILRQGGRQPNVCQRLHQQRQHKDTYDLGRFAALEWRYPS
jgi:hypothetical protein